MAKNKEKQISGPVWGRRLASEAGKANVAYCAGYDVRGKEPADLKLLPYDLWANRAHCIMLAKVKILPTEKLRRILRALDALEKEAEAGKFVLRPELEDVHLNVEAFVEEHEGVEVAGIMHTARSRNDQVATDMRLFLRDQLLAFSGEAIGMISTLIRLAKSHSKTLMPGLTHHQPAAWTTFGHWAASHAYAFCRDVQAMLDLHELLNLSPLGAAASYGTSWPIDRNFAAAILGFRDCQVNTLDCVTNRVEFDSRAAFALAAWAQHAATLSQDLILFSSPPWSLMRIGDAYVTGSSIMPQKRNPDFAEVTKAKASLAGSVASALLDLTRGDPSGYNREQQWSKYLIMDLFEELSPAPLVISGALQSLTLDRKRMRSLMSHDYLEAADVADYLAQTRKVPFRVAYRWLGEAVRRSEDEGISLIEAVNAVLGGEKSVPLLSERESALLSDPCQLVERRWSMGGPASFNVMAQAEALRDMVSTLRASLARNRAAIHAARKRLAREIEALTR